MHTSRKGSIETIEKHLIRFLQLHPGPTFQAYRRRCLSFWRDAYGEATVERVKAALAKEFPDDW